MLQAKSTHGGYDYLMEELAEYERAYGIPSPVVSASHHDSFIGGQTRSDEINDIFRDADVLDITPIGSRCFKVHTRNRSYLSKKIRKDSFEKQANTFLSKVGFATHLPSIVENYSTTNVLTWHYIDGKIDEVAIFDNAREKQTELFFGVIDTLVRLHSMQPGNIRMAPEIIDPGYFENLNLQQYDRLPGPECHEFVRGYQRLGTMLRELRDRTRPVLIHGDFKLDNVLHTANGELYFIDWEAAGLGSPARDMGNLAGCFISSWLSYTVTKHTGSYGQILPSGPWSAWECFSFVNRLVDHFCARHAAISGIIIDRNDIWRYAGIFLMQRSWVQSNLSGRQTLASKMANNLGEKLTRQPQCYEQYFPARAAVK